MSESMEPTQVYLENGQIVMLLERVGNGAVICHLYEDQYGNEQFGEATYVPVVFDQPPAPKFDEQTRDLHAEIDRLYKDAASVRKMRDDLKRELSEVESRCQHIPVLKDVLAYIDGKITHYVICEDRGSIRILTLEETIGRDNWDRESRMLSLNAKPGRRELQWHLYTYSDGSGYGTHVIPCMSEEMARTEAMMEFDRAVTAWRTAEKPDEWAAGRFVETATILGLTIPEDIARVDALYDLRIAKEHADRSHNDHAKKLDALRIAEEAAARFIAGEDN